MCLGRPPRPRRGLGGGRVRPAAIGTGRAPGGEDEVETGRGREAAEHAIVEHDEPSIEELADLDADAGIGATTPELDPALAERDGVVAGHDAAIATAQDESEILGRAAPHGLRGGGRPGEAAIE